MKLSIRDLDLTDKRVLIRVDFNVPLKDGAITDDTRIRETIPTIEYALRRKARVILCSHLGRPKGKVVESMSLRPVVDRLRLLLDHVIDQDENVAFSPDCVGEIATELANNLESGQPLLLENLRFHPEEEANDPGLCKTTRQPLRHLRQRRLRERPPCSRLDGRHHPLRQAVCRWPAYGQGTHLPWQGRY